MYVYVHGSEYLRSWQFASIFCLFTCTELADSNLLVIFREFSLFSPGRFGCVRSFICQSVWILECHLDSVAIKSMLLVECSTSHTDSRILRSRYSRLHRNDCRSNLCLEFHLWSNLPISVMDYSLIHSIHADFSDCLPFLINIFDFGICYVTALHKLSQRIRIAVKSLLFNNLSSPMTLTCLNKDDLEVNT